VISGRVSAGGFDGSAPKLWQPLGICVEFGRDALLADSRSGSIKIINRPMINSFKIYRRLSGLLTFIPEKYHLQNLIIPSTKESEMVENVPHCVQAYSQRAKLLQLLKESSTTDVPEGTVSNKSLKSLELLKKSLISMYVCKCMYVCKSLFKHGKSSVKLKLKTKTNYNCFT